MATEVRIHVQHFWVCPECQTINLITDSTCRVQGCNGELELKYIKPTLAQAVQFLAEGGEDTINKYVDLTTPEIDEEYDDMMPWSPLYSCHSEETIRSTVLQYIGVVPQDFDELVCSVTTAFNEMTKDRNKLFPVAMDAAYDMLLRMAAYEAGPGDTAGDLTPKLFTPIEIARSLARLAGVTEY